MAVESFETALDPDHYFQGLARQELDFHQALGELIDNSISARRQTAGGLVPILIEVTVEETDDGTYTVQIADNGVGIELDDIKTKIFNPGGQGATRGRLNEHGFGLKNALALLTGGNSTGFTLLTRHGAAALDPDHFYAVTGPLSTKMSVRDDADRASWSEDLHHLNDTDTGTKVRIQVRQRYFKTIYRVGNPGFDILIRRLAEHIGVMHRHSLAQGAKMRLAYRRKGGDWTHHEIVPIPIPFEGETTSKTKTITVSGVTHQFSYVHGLLDYTAKDAEAEQEKGWPYPLKIYYQGSNARCGIDIVVRDRVIKSGVFEEIWPDIGKTVDFNRFVGELRVDEKFRTTNNKTGLDPHSENWEELLKQLGADEFRPEKATRKQSEESLRQSLVTILEGTFTGKKCVTNRAVWGGGVQIDIFLEAAPDNIRIYELKVTDGRVLDLYQLLMAWDGLVKENIHPTVGILVCKSLPPLLQEAATAANARSDASGKTYKIELKTVHELVPGMK